MKHGEFCGKGAKRYLLFLKALPENIYNHGANRMTALEISMLEGSKSHCNTGLNALELVFLVLLSIIFTLI